MYIYSCPAQKKGTIIQKLNSNFEFIRVGQFPIGLFAAYAPTPVPGISRTFENKIKTFRFFFLEINI